MTGAGHQPYILGIGNDELSRLAFQHRVWAEQTYALWERAGFKSGQTILDVGCGPGFASIDLAHLVGPDGRVIALDAAQPYLDRLEQCAVAERLTNIETRLCDVQQADLPRNIADGAYARWVLCFVSDPQAVVRHVADALRPGGVFAVTDYVNYRTISVYPRSAAFDRFVAMVNESWRIRGGDPDICAKLPGIMTRCGLTVKEINPIVRSARPGTPLWRWPETFIRNFMPTLIEMNLLTHDDAQALDSDWRTLCDDPAAFLLTPMVVEIIASKN